MFPPFQYARDEEEADVMVALCSCVGPRLFDKFNVTDVFDIDQHALSAFQLGR